MNSTIARSESGGNAEDLEAFRLLERAEILPPQGLIHPSAHGSIAYLFSVPAQRGAFVGAARAAIDDPADMRVALHGAPLGARRPGADVVGAVDHHEPHGDYARKALAVEVGQPQEFFVLAERLERRG